MNETLVLKPSQDALMATTGIAAAILTDCILKEIALGKTPVEAMQTVKRTYESVLSGLIQSYTNPSLPPLPKDSIYNAG